MLQFQVAGEIINHFRTYFKVGEHTVKLRTLYNGATIKQCNKFIVEFQKRFLDRRIGETVSVGHKKQLQRRIMDISTA